MASLYHRHLDQHRLANLGLYYTILRMQALAGCRLYAVPLAAAAWFGGCFVQAISVSDNWML
jgi:hypothetical protein